MGITAFFVLAPAHIFRMPLAILATRINPVTVVRSGNPSSLHNDGQAKAVSTGKIFFPLFVVTSHAKSVVTNGVSFGNGSFEQSFTIRVWFCPADGISHQTMVVYHQWYTFESFCIGIGNPFEYFYFIWVVIILHAMCFSPFTKPISINKIYFIGIVKSNSKGLKKLFVFLLKHGIVRIRRPYLGIIRILKTFRTGFLYIKRCVLSLVAAVYIDTESQSHTTFTHRSKQFIDTWVRIVPYIISLFTLKHIPIDANVTCTGVIAHANSGIPTIYGHSIIMVSLPKVFIPCTSQIHHPTCKGIFEYRGSIRLKTYCLFGRF